MTRSVPSSRSAVPLGVDALDRIVARLPEGCRMVLSNEPGVELDLVLAEAAGSHLSEGREVVYAVLRRSPDNVRNEIRNLGANQADLDRLFIVDAFSAMLGTDDRAHVRVDDPDDPRALVYALEAMADEHPEAVVVVDSLSGMADRASMAGLRSSFTRLADALAAFRCALVAFTLWPYDSPYQDLLDAFEGEVRFGRMDASDLTATFFEIRRADWDEAAATGVRHLYKVVPPEGVHVYIPKIVVTGPPNAGKSTFVRTVSDTAVSVDRLGTTVALDHGHVQVDGLSAELFGTPGQVRFDPLLDTVTGRAMGVILLVDSTQPSTFPRARELVDKTRSQGLPMIVVSSKQDLEDALSPDDLARELALPDDVEVAGCSVEQPGTCHAVLERMAQQILDVA